MTELLRTINTSNVTLKQDFFLLVIGIICYMVKTGINLEEYSLTGRGIRRNSFYHINMMMALIANFVMFFAFLLAGTHLGVSGLQYVQGSYRDTDAAMERMLNETYFAEIEAMKSASKELEEMGVVYVLDDPKGTVEQVTKSVKKFSSSFYVEDKETGQKKLVSPL